VHRLASVFYHHANKEQKTKLIFQRVNIVLKKEISFSNNNNNNPKKYYSPHHRHTILFSCAMSLQHHFLIDTKIMKQIISYELIRITYFSCFNVIFEEIFVSTWYLAG